MRSTEEMAKESNDLKTFGSKMPQLMSEVGTEREQVYEAFEKAEVPPTEDPKEPEIKAEAEKKEPEKAELVKEEITEEKKVPLGALHEEREKRKALSSEVKELKGNLAQLIEDNKKLMELMSTKESDEPITDYEKELVNLKKQNKVLSEKLSMIERGQVQEKQKTEADKLTELVKKTDSELATEGFEGFDDFVPQVIKAMNEEEIPMEERTPATWKRVYREMVFPKYIGKYKVTTKESRKAEKEDLKKDAGLVKSPGRTETKPKEEDDYISYMKMREKYSFMGR
jgi:hypothetical protein